jgi:cysteine synthase
MAESFSVERRKLMRMLGAKVVLTPASEKRSGMLAKARELAETHGWFLDAPVRERSGSRDFHSRTTAEEIVRRLRRCAARLLGHGLRHRWNA